jgi:hypothetical protein
LPIGKKMLRRYFSIFAYLLLFQGLGGCNGSEPGLCSPQVVEAYDLAAKNFKIALESRQEGRSLASGDASSGKLSPEQAQALTLWADQHLREVQNLIDTLGGLTMRSAERTLLRHKLNDFANELGSLSGYAPRAREERLLKMLEDLDTRANAIHALACGRNS